MHQQAKTDQNPAPRKGDPKWKGICEYKNAAGVTYYRGYAGVSMEGRKIIKSCRVFQDAYNWRREKLVEIENHGRKRLDVSDELIGKAQRLETFCQERGGSLEAAVAFWDRHNNPKEGAITLSALVAQYMADPVEASGWRPKHRKHLQSLYGHFKDDFGSRPSHDIRPKEITKWILEPKCWGTERVFRKWSEKTMKNVKNSLSALFEFAVRGKHLVKNPCSEVRLPEVPKTAIRVLTLEECADLLRLAWSTRETAGFLPYTVLCLFAGLRPSEACRVTWSDIRLESCEPTIRVEEHKDGIIVVFSPMPPDSSNNSPAEPPLLAENAATKPAGESKIRRANKASSPLLFIDTNILLDFYRARNDAGTSLLSKIDGLHNQTIITCQVEMEFKKNRQKVITEAVMGLKLPDFNLSIPAFLSDAASVKVIKASIKSAKTRVDKLKERILSTLEKPKTHDQIYQTAQRLFTNSGSLNLRHDTPEYRKIWRKALRRFLEGRPPRKKEDTSAGDAVNWEWILQCIEETNRDVIIVSRDADYGLTHDGKSYVNNWLSEELKERVNQQRKLILVDRLSGALRLLDVKVTPEELSVERAIIKSRPGAEESEVEQLVDVALDDLLNEDEISSLMAETNTDGWMRDDFILTNVECKNGAWIAGVTFTFLGEQNLEKPFHGNKISGHCIATIDREKQVSFSHLTVELNRDEYMPKDDEIPPDTEPSKKS